QARTRGLPACGDRLLQRQRRTLRDRGRGPRARSGHDVAAARAHAASLERTGRPGDGRARVGHARRGRLRHVDAPGFRAVLGVSGRLVELDRQLRRRRRVPGPVRRVSAVLVPVVGAAGALAPRRCLHRRADRPEPARRAPGRACRSAMFLTLPILIAAYLLPVGAALASGALPWSEWTTGVLPTIARSVGGDWLGHAVAAGAVLSTAGLFMSLLLTNSRLPYVLARDHAMPRWLGAVDPRFGTPWTAVVVSAALYAAFAVFSFKELIVLNIWLYSLSLLVELAAFVRLRVSAPAMPRPWRLPGGLGGAIIVVVFPALFCVGAMATAGWTNTIAGVAAALTGPLAHRGLRRRPI